MSAGYTPRPRAARLTSLKDLGRSTPAYTPPPRPRPTVNNDCCNSPDIQEMDGNRVCLSCGTMFTDSNIVAEVTFGETSAGAAVVQGGFVGEGQRHARTMGSGFRRAGGGGSESREQTEYNGREEIRKLVSAMNLSSAIEEQGFAVYKLALANNFIQGRRTRTVAAVCLYIACRRTSGNTTLLMDFAERIQVNVFKLGEVYKDLLKELFLDMGEGPNIIEVEPLLLKFARKLEFGPATMQVATDAAKIIRRMKRDWMVEGRQPAGLCGACLILAARMNNFRRTVREVVYVVKVADATIINRLEEFKRTQSSALTVEQFRKYGAKLKTKIEPPSVYKARERELEKKRKLDQILGEGEESTVISSSDEASPAAESQAGDLAEHRAKRVRFENDQNAAITDADGLVDPNLAASTPSDSQLDDHIGHPSQSQTPDPTGASQSPDPSSSGEQQNPKGKKGKAGKDEAAAKSKKRTKRPPPPPIADEDLEIEDGLENEIDQILTDPDTFKNMDDAVYAASRARATNLANKLRQRREIPESEEIGENEFEDDPEISTCLLTPAEIAIKERIWVTMNEDWLRAQQAKMLRKTLEEANGGKKKIHRRKSKGRMGDGSVLEGDKPVKDAADAALRMLQKRSKGNFSRYINYEKLQDVYGSSKVKYKGIRKEGEGDNAADVATPGSSGGESLSHSAPANTTQDQEVVVEEEVEEEEEESPEVYRPVLKRPGARRTVLPTPRATQARTEPAQFTPGSSSMPLIQQPRAIGGEDEEVEEIIEDDAEEEIEEDDRNEHDDYDEVTNPMNFTGEWGDDGYEGYEEYD